MSEEGKKRSRPPAAKERTEDVIAAQDDAAADVVATAAEVAKETAAAIAHSNGAPLTAEEATIKSADVSDEMKSHGPVFGDFLKAVGFAVAETQEKLDKTFRDTAHALSEDRIDVIAMFEQQIDDDGKMQAGKPHVQKLPLINYIAPTVLEVSHCSLSADMKVREFSAGNAFQIQGKSAHVATNASASGSMFGFNASGSVSAGYSQSETSGGSNVATDEAVGNMHLEATIQPRETVALPKPFVTQVGPSLKLVVKKTEALTEDVTPPGGDANAPKVKKRVGTKVTITATLVKSDGHTPLSAKSLEVNVNQPTVGRELPDGSKTNADGELTVVLSREGVDDWKPLETTLRVWMGLVSADIIAAL